jgi:hypothetical protein
MCRQNRCGRGWCRWAGTVAAGTPPGRSTGCCSRPTGAAIDWTWTFTYMAALVPADYVMAHSMLAGISLRVQAVR